MAMQWPTQWTGCLIKHTRWCGLRSISLDLSWISNAEGLSMLTMNKWFRFQDRGEMCSQWIEIKGCTFAFVSWFVPNFVSRSRVCIIILNKQNEKLDHRSCIWCLSFWEKEINVTASAQGPIHICRPVGMRTGICNPFWGWQTYIRDKRSGIGIRVRTRHVIIIIIIRTDYPPKHELDGSRDPCRLLQNLNQSIWTNHSAST